MGYFALHIVLALVLPLVLSSPRGDDSQGNLQGIGAEGGFLHRADLLGVRNRVKRAYMYDYEEYQPSCGLKPGGNRCAGFSVSSPGQLTVLPEFGGRLLHQDYKGDSVVQSFKLEENVLYNISYSGCVNPSTEGIRATTTALHWEFAVPKSVIKGTPATPNDTVVFQPAVGQKSGHLVFSSDGLPSGVIFHSCDFSA